MDIHCRQHHLSSICTYPPLLRRYPKAQVSLTGAKPAWCISVPVTFPAGVVFGESGENLHHFGEWCYRESHLVASSAYRSVIKPPSWTSIDYWGWEMYKDSMAHDLDLR